MFASIIRIALLVGLIFGGYKLYPKIKPILAPILANPKILGSQALEPVIKTANNILPENLQIPTNKPASSPNTSPSPTSAAFKNIVDEVKQKAGEAAQNQIDTVKKETGNAFCVALVETIKKQCGLNN